MFTIIDTDTFFKNDPPAGLPADSPPPNFNALVARTERIDTSRYPLDALKAVLKAGNTRLGADASSLDAIESIGGDSVFVVCGQQAGLFGGPLYTLYKAMHAVRLAKRLTDASGRNIVPIFWVASDDHDFEEVKSLGTITRDGGPLDIAMNPENRREDTPVGDIILDGAIVGAIETLSASCTPGETANRFIELIRRSWRPGQRWTEAFAEQMLGMFEGRGLVLFDPRWEGVKKLFADVYREEISHPADSARLVNEAADSFGSASERKRALRRPEGATNLFLESDGVRHSLMFRDGVFSAGTVSYSSEDLHAIVADHPERLSPAAALRPVCQDAVMPVAAFIAGPGERRYLSQLGMVYDRFGVDASTVWPRASFTIVDRRTVRNAEKEGIPLENLFVDPEKLKADLARWSFPEQAARDLDNLDNAVMDGFASVAKSVAAIDPTLEKAVNKELGRALHITAGVRERAMRAHKASSDISERRLEAAVRLLFPDGVPQERRYGMNTILGVLGGDGFEVLIEATSPGEEHHRIVLPE